MKKSDNIVFQKWGWNSRVFQTRWLLKPRGGARGTPRLLRVNCRGETLSAALCTHNQAPGKIYPLAGSCPCNEMKRNLRSLFNERSSADSLFCKGDTFTLSNVAASYRKHVAPYIIGLLRKSKTWLPGETFQNDSPLVAMLWPWDVGQDTNRWTAEVLPGCEQPFRINYLH